MNKNIITLGVMVGASVMTNMSSLTSPYVELYSDNLVQKSRSINVRPLLTQISKAKMGKNYLDVSTYLLQSSNISFRSAVIYQLDDAAILASVAQRIKNSKPLSDEFSKIIDDNFWDLI